MQLYWKEFKPGDKLSLVFDSEVEGTYYAKIQFTVAPDYGTFAPVSYTHLDVYKRQVLYDALGFQVSDMAEVELALPKKPKGITVYDMNGRKVAAQLLSYADGKARLCLLYTSFPQVSWYRMC